MTYWFCDVWGFCSRCCVTVSVTSCDITVLLVQCLTISQCIEFFVMDMLYDVLRHCGTNPCTVEVGIQKAEIYNKQEENIFVELEQLHDFCYLCSSITHSLSNDKFLFYLNHITKLLIGIQLCTLKLETPQERGGTCLSLWSSVNGTSLSAWDRLIQDAAW